MLPNTTSTNLHMHCVICTHGRPRLLARTLHSLAQMHPPPATVRYWVVENGSDAGARRVVSEFASQLPITYVHRPSRGKSQALQAMLDTIDHGLMVFTDDDVRVTPQWLCALARAANQHGPDAFYGGPLHVDYEQPPKPWLIPHLPPSARGWELRPSDAPITQACFLGANYAAFASTLRQVGGFETHLGVGSPGNPVGEEFDIQDRLLQAGVRGVYVPEAVVWHWVPRQRCSPRWTLGRHERIYLTNGLTEAAGLGDAEGPQLLGVPRWMWRRLAQLKLRAAASILHPGAQRRFAAQLAYRQYRGYLRGLRQRGALRRKPC